MSLFVAITCVLFAGTFIVILKNSITQESKIAKGVWIIYYSMIAIMAFVMFAVTLRLQNIILLYLQ